MVSCSAPDTPPTTPSDPKGEPAASVLPYGRSLILDNTKFFLITVQGKRTIALRVTGDYGNPEHRSSERRVVHKWMVEIKRLY